MSAVLESRTWRSRLRRSEASEYLFEVWGVSYTPRTLAKMATIGGGPAFQKFGRYPLYPTNELDSWAESRLGELKRSTSA